MMDGALGSEVSTKILPRSIDKEWSIPASFRLKTMLEARILSQLFLVQGSLRAISPYLTRTESKEVMPSFTWRLSLWQTWRSSFSVRRRR